MTSVGKKMLKMKRCPVEFSCKPTQFLFIFSVSHKNCVNPSGQHLHPRLLASSLLLCGFCWHSVVLLGALPPLLMVKGKVLLKICNDLLIAPVSQKKIFTSAFMSHEIKHEMLLSYGPAIPAKYNTKVKASKSVPWLTA